MSEYIITSEQIEELNRANGGMQIVTSWLSAYAIFDTSKFPPQMKSEHLAITLPNIVRCRDCTHYCDHSGKHTRGEGIGTCDLDLEWTDLYSIVEPDGFCAWGERSENCYDIEP